MAIFLVGIATFLASGLTLFSGFGLGTILMPVLAIFTPVSIAIAITAIVHFLNKVFKLLLLWRAVDVPVLFKFGFPALLASIPGALLLSYFASQAPIGEYEFFGNQYYIFPVKLLAGILLIIFAAAESSPFLKNSSISKSGLLVGGILSGFFGGLTGHQGAFRSAFLAKTNLSEKVFVATNAAIAALVDLTRIAIYGLTFDFIIIQDYYSLTFITVVSCFAGVFVAARFLDKITMPSIQKLIAVMMYIFGILLCVGII